MYRDTTHPVTHPVITTWPMIGVYFSKDKLGEKNTKMKIYEQMITENYNNLIKRWLTIGVVQ